MLLFNVRTALTAAQAHWPRIDLAGNVAAITFLKIGYCHVVADLEVSEALIHTALHYRSIIIQFKAKYIIRSCLHSYL
jgi:hypothetical protein